MDIDKKYRLELVISKRQYIKPPKEKGKKVKCTDCKHFKYDYYCNKMKRTAPYYNKSKVCKYFVK